MRTQKVLAIFVLLGLIFTPLSGTTGIQNAMAEQANPPTVSNEGELNTDASEGGVIQQIQKPPTNETDPNQDVNQDFAFGGGEPPGKRATRRGSSHVC